MTHRFRDDYVTLGLEDNADWHSAQIQYRRQVNRWHPDRFAQRPRERLHAEQQFIQLSKAFERIRTFYRTNSRLPFELLDKDLSSADASSESSPGATRKRAGSRATNIERPDFRRWFDGRNSRLRSTGRETARVRTAGSGRRLLLWLVPGMMVAATGVLFVFLDRSAQQASVEKARKHLIEQAPDNDIPSTAEIHNRNRRGAFVEGEKPGKIGDMLMPDVFGK